MDDILKNVEQHLFPQNVDEVLESLKDESCVILAGGTELTLERNDTIHTLVDLKDLGLSYIKEDENTFYIGAMTSAYDIANYESLPDSLRLASRCVGDNALLNAVTIGGNLAKLYAWVDLPPVLWALNASITLYDPEKKVLQSDEFFSYSKERNVFSRKALITEILVPKPSNTSYCSYQSLTLTSIERAQLNLAFFASWSENILSEVRIILSAAVNQPLRLKEIEKMLKGKNLDELKPEFLDDVDLESIELIHDYKSSISYRKRILKIYLKRALQGLIDERRRAT